MSENDLLTDFDPSTGHLNICWMHEDMDSRCNRDCAVRLYAVAARLINGAYGVETPPECEQHSEVQHHDGRVPWCNMCGWNRGTPLLPSAKIGTPRRELPGYGVHQSWNPTTGYQSNGPITEVIYPAGVQNPVVDTGWPRTE